MYGKCLIALGGILVLGLGCSQAPEIPTFPPTHQHPVQRILLDDEISPQDIREIFAALNQNGQLEGLKKWMVGPTDEELKVVGSILSHHVYERALSPNEGLGLFRNAVIHRTFSSLEKRLSGYTNTEQVWVGLQVLEHPTLPEIIRRDLPLLRLGLSIQEEKPLLKEMLQFLGQADVQQHSLHLLESTESRGLGMALSEAIAKSDNNSRLGFSKGIATLLKTKRPKAQQSFLEDLFLFAHATNRDSSGLFQVFQQQLASQPIEILFPAIAEEFRRVLLERFTESILSQFSDRKTPQEWSQLSERELFRRILMGVTRIETTQSEMNSGALASNAPIYLNSMALALWLKQSMASPPILISLTTEVDGKLRLSELARELLRDVSAEVQLEFIEKNMGFEGFLTTQFVFEEAHLEGAIAAIHEQSPFVDVSARLRALSTGLVGLDLESENVMDMLNRVLYFPLSQIRPVKEQVYRLFYNQGKQNALADQFLKHYRGHPSEGTAKSIVELFPAVYSLDESVDGLPSALEFYRSVVLNLPVKSVQVATEGLDWVHLTGLLDRNRYPEIRRFFESAENVERVLDSVSKMSTERREEWLAAMNTALGTNGGVSGLSLHFGLLNEMVGMSLEGSVGLLEMFFRYWPTVSNWVGLSWFERLLEDPECDKFWALAQKASSVEASRELMATLIELERKGVLLEAAQLLALIQDERMRAIAEALTESLKSGEMKALLGSLDRLLRD